MKTSILLQHGIKVTELPNGVILADNQDGTFTNVTNMDVKSIYKFLGY
jgi:hypothetical protein